MNILQATGLSRIFALMISLLVAFSWSAAEACSPRKLTPEEIIESADHIIIANAVRSKWVSEHKPSVVNAVLSFFAGLLPYDETQSQGETQFKIRRAIKGDAPEYITIRHDVSGAACGVTFDADENYLLFVSEHKKKYFVSVFGVKPFLSEAEYDELLERLGVREDDYVYVDEGYLIPADSEWLSK